VNEEERMTYGTKVDSWIGLVLWLVPIGLVFEAIFLRSRVVAAVAVSVLVVYWLVIFPTNYELGPDTLKIRSGVIRTAIPYQEIHRVRASNSWLSAPALSLDRLEITYGAARKTLASPRDRTAFLRDLSARAPGLKLESI
jgi:membrane protein YdbS with pleckstrin-like domain